MKKIFQIIFLFLHSSAFCCDCPQINEKTYLKDAILHSEIVFQGKLIHFDTIKRTYEFRIIELFKGTYHSKKIAGYAGNSNCTRFPKHKGLWLIFSNLENNRITLDGCNPSYAFGSNINFKPFIKLHHINWVSNRKLSKTDSLENEIHLLNQKIEAISQWHLDIEKLREYKKETEINQGTKSKSEPILIWLVILLFLILLLFFKLIYK